MKVLLSLALITTTKRKTWEKLSWNWIKVFALFGFLLCALEKLRKIMWLVVLGNPSSI